MPKKKLTNNQIAFRKAVQRAQEGPNPIFLNLCRGAGLPDPECEYKFHPSRKWRFDYCWPELRVALEVEGGVFSGGRHTRGAGFLRDMTKYNEAARLGWVVVRTVPSKLAKPATVKLIVDVAAAHATDAHKLEEAA